MHPSGNSNKTPPFVLEIREPFWGSSSLTRAAIFRGIAGEFLGNLIFVSGIYRVSSFDLRSNFELRSCAFAVTGIALFSFGISNLPRDEGGAVAAGSKGWISG